MALSATFSANFSSLYKELDKAEVAFRELAVDATKVNDSVQKIGERFSGQKVIEDAAKMAKAIEEIGGASILTEKEAKRVNATLNEALEKAAKTGAPVTAEMQRLATATAGAAQQGGLYEKVIGGLGTAAKAAAASFIAMFAFTEVIRMGKALMDFGGEMTDLSAKTGLSTTALQQFKYAGGQVGVELGTITSGVNMLQKRLAGDDKSAVKALDALGIASADFKRLKPEEQFTVLAQKVGAIEDPMLRTKAATDLFGKSGAELLPVLTKEFTDLTDKANSLGIIMDEQTVAAMDTLGDTVSDLGSVAFAALGKIITPLIPLLSTMASVSLQVASVLGDRLSEAINIVGVGVKWLANRYIEMTLSLVETMQTVSRYVPGLEKATGATTLLGQAADKLRGMQASLNAEQTTSATKSKAVAVAAEEAEKSTNKQASAVAALVKELSGAGAIEKVKTLEAAFKQLTPEQQGNERVIREVLGQYEKYRDIVGTQVAPAVEDLFVKHGTLKSKTIDLTTAFVELKPAIEGVIGKYGELGLLASESRTDIDASKMSVEEWAKKTGAVLAPALQSASVSVEVAKEKTTDWRGSLDNLVRSFEQLSTIGGGSLKGLVQWMGQVMASSKLARDGGDAFAKSLEGVKNGGKEAVASMINLAAGAMSIISAMDQATSSGNTLQRTIGGVNAGFQAGNAIFPGVGGAIGAVAGGLVGLVRGLTGVSEETKKVRGEIASFEENLRKNLTTTQAAEAAGRNWAATTIAVRDAFVLTGRSASEAEAIVKQLWDDKNPNAARAAIEKINAVMAEAKRIAEELDNELNGALSEAVNLGIQLPDELSASIQSLIDMGTITGDNATLFASLSGNSQNQFKVMEDAAKKYGVELSALGPAFAQNKLDERARDIIDAFGAMTRGGGDVAGVIGGMSDEINQFVQDAISSGRQVPENMRPIIEAMIEQGRLTDANGTKLEDMSGINFGPPVESAFDRIIKKLEELIAKIGGGMGFDQATANAQNFATQATTAINNIPRVVPIRFEGSGDDFNNDGDPGYASGTLGRTGSWFKNFGAGTLTALHGEEAVVRRDQARSFAQAFGGGDSGTVDELRNLRADMMALPQHLARAVRDAILVAG